GDAARVEIDEVRRFNAAGRAPGRPEIDDDHLSAQIGEPDPLPVERRQFEVRREAAVRAGGKRRAEQRAPHFFIQGPKSSWMNSFVPGRPVSRSQSGPPSRSKRTATSKNGQHRVSW